MKMRKALTEAAAKNKLVHTVDVPIRRELQIHSRLWDY